MPKVPTYQASDSWVSPTDAQLRAPDVSSGGEAIAQGGAQLGGAIDNMANARFQIMDMSAQTVARQQALADSQAVSKLTTQYQTLQGQNAVDAQTGTLKQIGDIQTAGQKAMPNPLAAKYYTLHSGAAFAGANDTVNGHAVQQVHTAFGQQLGAETEAAQDNAANAYADPAKLDMALGAVRDAASKEAAFAGYSDDASNVYVAGKVGKVVQSAILAAKANKDYDLANALDLKYTAGLPMDMKNTVIGEMAPVLDERRSAAVYKAAIAGPAAPVMDENRNWIIPTGNGGTPDNSAPSTTPATAQPAAGFGMPVTGTISNTFAQHEARGSEGVDIAVPLGTPIKAPAPGQATVGYDDRSGNYVKIDHPDGSTSLLAHLGTVQVKTGDQVNGNTILGAAGMTGDATGPHVHWQVTGADDKPVDPLTLVHGNVGAAASVTAPGGTIVPNEAQVIARIQAMDLPQAQKDSAINYAHGQMRDAQQAQSYSYEQAHEQAVTYASNYALAHGGNYPTDLPPSVAAIMRPDEYAKMKLDMFQSNKGQNDEATAKAQGTHYADLQVMRYDHPDQFLALDPKQVMGQVSAGQYNEIRVSQAEMRAQQNKPQPFDPYGGSSKALETYARFNPDILPKPSDSDYSPQRAALLDGIRARAIDFVATKHTKPSTSDWNAFAQDAAHQTVTTPGVLWGSTTKPAYQITGSDVPADKRAIIIQSYQKAHPGQTPTEQEIADRYRLIAH